MIAQPAAVKLELISSEAATMSFNSPFGCLPEALQTAVSTLNGWSRAMICSDTSEELDVTVEFVYGDYIYHEKHTLFNPTSGGVETTLFCDAGICDWMEDELPRRMVAQWF